MAVFRISGKLFENAINRTFSREEKVDMWILDVYGEGDAHVEGEATDHPCPRRRRLARNTIC